MVALAALALVALGAAGFTGGFRLPGELPAALLLAAFAAVAVHFPIEVVHRQKTNLAPAVYFALLLLTGTADAMLLTLASRLAGEPILYLRRSAISGRRRRDPWSIVFNAAQSVLAVAAGGTVLSLLGGIGWHHAPGASRPSPAIALAAVAMYATSSLLVAAGAGVQVRRNPLLLWAEGRRGDLGQELATYLLGLVAAAAAIRSWWAPALVALPGVVLMLSLRRSLRFSAGEHVVAAVEAMADAVDARHPTTFGHSRRVAALAEAMARQLGLDAYDVATIRAAARVHDIGKMAVADAVLLKRGPLTATEYEELRRYPQVGHDILSRFPEFDPVRPLVLTHRERLDGRGFPHGLAGAQLPLGAQLVAAADALDEVVGVHPGIAYAEPAAVADLYAQRGGAWSDVIADAVARQAERADTAAGAAAHLAEIGRRLKRLDEAVQYDDLTGVLRREAGSRRLQECLATRRPVAAAFVDVDGLKTTNDSEGHDAGDRLLIKVAEALIPVAGKEGGVFRYGGDEFICFRFGTAEALRDDVQRAAAAVAAEGGRSTFSVGTAGSLPEDDVRALLRRADAALYAGRSQVRRAPLEVVGGSG